MPDLIERLAESLECDPLVHYFEAAFQRYPDMLMKDMTLEAVGAHRQAKLNGRWVVTFGSDSFLGLDQDPRVWDAVRRGLERWGTHNGSSRAFASVASNVEAERKLATWLKSESTLISITGLVEAIACLLASGCLACGGAASIDSVAAVKVG